MLQYLEEGYIDEDQQDFIDFCVDAPVPAELPQNTETVRWDLHLINLHSHVKPESTGTNPQLSSLLSEDDKKLAMKRQKGKMRSKQARDRKKRYIEELEAQVRDLSKENMKLSQLVEQYRNQVPDVKHKPTATLDAMIESFRSEICKGLDKDEEAQWDNNTSRTVIENFNSNAFKSLIRHQAFIDKNFECISENFIPLRYRSYWEDLEASLDTEFDTLKKLNKVSKYKKPEFIEQHNLNKFDEYLAALNPNKIQLRILKKVIIPKEISVKKQVQEGFEHLVRAKAVFTKAMYDLFVLRSTILNSGFFSDTQLLSAFQAELSQPCKDTKANKLFSLQKERSVLNYDLTKDKILRKFAKKYLSPSDQKLRFEYTSYSLRKE